MSRRQPPPKPLVKVPKFQSLDEVSRWLEEFTRRAFDPIAQQVLDAYESAPAPHAATHKGGTDSVISSRDPEPVGLTGEADPGTPGLGAAAVDHVHAPDEDLASLAGLAGVTTDEADGVAVHDHRVRRLLEEVLVELHELRDHLG